MKNPQEKTFQKLFEYLHKAGPQKAKQICSFLGISQPTFSRLLLRQDPPQYQDTILRIGQGRQTLYACWRVGSGGLMKIPLFFLNEKEGLEQAATIHFISPQGYYLESHHRTMDSRHYDHLPYFFEDLRPSGFLGRLEPKLYPNLDLPSDISRWSDDQAFTYWHHAGWDLIGNYFFGEEAHELFLKHRISRTDICLEKNRISHYPETANKVLAHGIPGSSAGGEHPKFLSILKVGDRLTPVMVKFSPPVRDAISQRIADLLICEHIAHRILKNAGKPVVKSCLVNGEDKRLFLEIERFDRIGSWGRRGLISLRALDLEFVGKLTTWSETSKVLHHQKRIDQETYKTILWLEVFGKLIGNSDRHHGNISFYCTGEKLEGLAPVYDMLPMMYAPVQNQLIERLFEPEPPKSAETDVWNEALFFASLFWSEVQNHPDISPHFKKLTADNKSKLSRYLLG